MPYLLSHPPFPQLSKRLASLGPRFCQLGGFIRFQEPLQNDCHLFYRNNLNSLNLKYQSSIVSDLVIKPMWQCQTWNFFFFFEKNNITLSYLVLLGKPTLSKLYSNLKEENPSNFQLYRSKSYKRNADYVYDA